MKFLSHFRREFRKRFHRSENGDEERTAERVNQWADANPGATEEEAKAVFTEQYKSGSILITLTLLLIVVELVYFIRAIRRQEGAGEAGDDE